MTDFLTDRHTDEVSYRVASLLKKLTVIIPTTYVVKYLVASK